MQSKPTLCALATLLFILAPPFNTWPQDESGTWDFEDTEESTVPAGWKIESTRPRGPTATWKVTEDGGGRVLSMTAPNHESRNTFNLCWNPSISFTNGEISLRFKANTGEVDQGGGPIWRAQDNDNYYVCRMNPLEDNFRLYYVKDGRRKEIASADIVVASGEWHEITVRHQGSHIECDLNGKKLLEVDDETFSAAGGVGFWTKADAVTSFDDLRVTAESK